MTMSKSPSKPKSPAPALEPHPILALHSALVYDGIRGLNRQELVRYQTVQAKPKYVKE